MEKKIEEYKLVEVPTQTALVIESPTEEKLNMEMAIVEILNKLDKILSKF